MTIGEEVEISRTFFKQILHKLLEMKPRKVLTFLRSWYDIPVSSVMVTFESPVLEAFAGDM